MKLRMPIKPLPDENIVEETDLFDDAKSWFTKLFSFVQLDSSKFPPVEYKLAAEYSRDKYYLYVWYNLYKSVFVCMQYLRTVVNS